MRNYILALAGLLLCLAAPPQAFACTSTPPGREVVREFKAVAPVMVAEATAVDASAAAVVASVAAVVPAPVEAVALPSETAGAAVHQYLSTVEAALRVRPGWRGPVGSGYTRHQTPELR